MSETIPCVDCIRLKIAEQRPTKYCPADDQWRCRTHRSAHFRSLGVGQPVPQPPASVGTQRSYL